MKALVLALCAALFAGAVHAAVDPDVEKRIRNALAMLLPGLTPDEVRATPIDNLYEVTFGTRLVYITPDARFLLQGKIIDLETRTEITDQRLSELKLAALAEVGEDRMVSYGPADARHTITVFTDIDCGFCRKLHAEMASYGQQGIRIRYLFYPRAGLGSPSYVKAVSVWCADDRKAAMDAAKAGRDIPVRECENPVAEHHALGDAIGIRGTPALVLDDGEVLPGYVPADKLRRALDQRDAETGS